MRLRRFKIVSSLKIRQGLKWKSQDLTAVHELVMKKEFTISATAYRYGIPKTALHAHVHGTRKRLVLAGQQDVTLRVLKEEKLAALSHENWQRLLFRIT